MLWRVRNSRGRPLNAPAIPFIRAKQPPSGRQRYGLSKGASELEFNARGATFVWPLKYVKQFV